MESLAQKRGRAQQLGLAAFGLSLRFETPPPGAWEEAWTLPEPSLPSLEIRSSVSAQAVADSWSGFEEIGWEGVIDGAPFVVERGVAGDHRFVHGAHLDQSDQSGALSDGTRAVHCLSPDARVLQCAPSDPSDPSWWRVVLDSVLFTVALLQGYRLCTPARSLHRMARSRSRPAQAATRAPC